jgi:C4-dicarboxylate-specific signal transduction histidine kinase
LAWRSVIIEVSRSRLIQAFTNILVNAIESYQDVASLKPIDVSASIEERLVLFTIKDLGAPCRPKLSVML